MLILRWQWVNRRWLPLNLPLSLTWRWWWCHRPGHWFGCHWNAVRQWICALPHLWRRRWGTTVWTTKSFTSSMTSDICLPDDLRRLGVASRRRRGLGSSPRSRFDSQTGSRPGMDQMGLGPLEQEDMVDKQGTRRRCFTTGVPPQESWVNMSVLDQYLRILSHGGRTSPWSDD